jgi:SAM-dependent methyltransferase
MPYDWTNAGEEWSAPWGSSAAQWSGAILPRIRNCLRPPTILEIGAGFGRWTHYLREHCETLIAVDRIDQCVVACRDRFQDDPRVRCVLNDGRSLPMVANDSIDFVFSFDSLVHAKPEMVESYLAELGTKLKAGGTGFIHHSNFGEYANSFRERLPKALTKVPIKMNLLDWDHRRDRTMTAVLFRDLCERHGLACLSQELVNWRGRRLIDCFSTISRPDRSQRVATRVIRNRNFMREAAELRAKSGITRSAER